MYKGFMINSSGLGHQPMETKKDKDTETDKDKTKINNEVYETRKLVTETVKIVKTHI